MKPISDSPIRGFRCLQYAYREVLGGRLIAFSFTTVCIAVVILTVLGPVGVGDGLNPLQRFALVGSCCALCWPLCHALSAAVLYLVRSQPPPMIVAACALGAIFMALPCTAVTYAIYGMFHPIDAVNVSVSRRIVHVAVLVLACSSLIHYVACQLVLLRQAGASAQGSGVGRGGNKGEQAATASGMRDRLFDRLPDALGRDLVYLNVTGHYVNVVTTRGSCLVLMRFADAIAALGDVGVRVHRSFWVAHRHVEGLSRRDDRTLIRVTGPHEIPVSRTYLASVRALFPAPGERPT